MQFMMLKHVYVRLVYDSAMFHLCRLDGFT